MVYKGLFSLTLEWEYDPSDEEIVFISSMKFESGKWERFHFLYRDHRIQVSSDGLLLTRKKEPEQCQ